MSIASRTIPKPPPLPARSYASWELAAARQTPAGLAHLASNGQFTTRPQHIALLDDKLWQLANGRIKRLMVFMPPRHGKSALCSHYFPAWYVGAFRKRFMLASYEASFAASWGRLARDVLLEFGPLLWNVHVSPTPSAADWWELEGAQGQNGVMMTAGVGGALTGKGAAILAIDDPVKNAEEAASPTMREKAWQWYTSTAYTRLEPDGAVLLIQTRWHEQDLAGRILSEQGPRGWDIISLPAIAEHDERYDIDGGDDFTRREGEALWPDRFSAQRLAAIRADVGSTVWAALYQQRPTPDGGLIWHREWFKRYSALGGLPQFTRIIQAVDTAFKTGVASDYSVIATWGYTGSAIYLLDIWRNRVEYPELKRALADQAAKWQPHVIYVEDAASGQSIIQELGRETALPIVPLKPLGSKEARAAAVSPLAESGNVYIPDSAPDKPWVNDWLEEHVAFPRGAHDDMVDTTSMALEQIRPDTFAVGPKIF